MIEGIVSAFHSSCGGALDSSNSLFLWLAESLHLPLIGIGALVAVNIGCISGINCPDIDQYGHPLEKKVTGALGNVEWEAVAGGKRMLLQGESHYYQHHR